MRLMHPRQIMIFTVLLLVGCVSSSPQTAFLIHKTGSNTAERKDAFELCEFEGIRNVPRAMVTDIDPGYSSPGTLQCNTVGTSTTCNRVGDINIPASSSTYDANEQIRDRYIQRCLRQKGFETYTRPICKTDAEKRGFDATLASQPPASQIVCIY